MARRIEICAPMGVGKTTLARALAAYGYQVVEERPADNPYLANFYATFSPAAAYQKDAWFVEHARACIASGCNQNSVMDFSVVLCRAYVDAGINTPDNALKLQKAFDQVERGFGPPAVLIVIDLPLDEQMRRIRARNRTGEADVSAAYLHALSAAVNARVQDAECHGMKVVRLDGLQYDFRDPAQVKKVAELLTLAVPATVGPRLKYAGPK